MLIGLYGGTFNPVHRGHVHAALAVKEKLDLPEVRMILSARPGHRQQPQVHNEHRWRMLELACADHSGLVPDAIELERPGASFTVRTLRELHRRHADLIACWILGQDAFATLTDWYEWQQIIELANLVVINRPGQEASEPDALRAWARPFATNRLDRTRLGQILRLQLPMLDVSSTQIRERIRQNVDVSDLLDVSVYTYIRTHGLYQNAEKPI